MKQISQVLDAIALGCETSDEVSAATGLPVAVASGRLTELARLGLVRVVARAARRYSNSGRASNVYGPAT